MNKEENNNNGRSHGNEMQKQKESCLSKLLEFKKLSRNTPKGARKSYRKIHLGVHYTSDFLLWRGFLVMVK